MLNLTNEPYELPADDEVVPKGEYLQEELKLPDELFERKGNFTMTLSGFYNAAENDEEI